MNKSLIILLLGVAAAGAGMIAFTLGSNSVPPTKEVLLPFANPAGEVAQNSSTHHAQERADSAGAIGELSTPVKPTSERVERIPRSEEASEPAISSTAATTPSPSSNFSSRASMGSPNASQPPAPASAAPTSIAVPTGGTVPAALAPNAGKSARTPQQQQMGDQIASEFLNEVDKPNTTQKEWSNAQTKTDQWYWKMFGSQQANRMGVEAATASLNPEAK